MNPFEETSYRKKLQNSFGSAFEENFGAKLTSPIEVRNEQALNKLYGHFFDVNEEEKPNYNKMFDSVFGEEKIPLSELKDVIGLFEKEDWTLDEALMWAEEQELEPLLKTKLKEFITISNSVIREEEMETSEVLSGVKEKIHDDVAIWSDEVKRLVALIDWKKASGPLEKIQRSFENPDMEVEDEVHDEIDNAILAVAEWTPSEKFDDCAEIVSVAAKKGWEQPIHEVIMVDQSAVCPSEDSVWKNMKGNPEIKALDPEEGQEGNTPLVPSTDLIDDVRNHENNRGTNEMEIMLSQELSGELAEHIHKHVKKWLSGNKLTEEDGDEGYDDLPENPFGAVGVCKKKYYDVDGNVLDARGRRV